MFLGVLLGALINLNGSGHYIHWGFIQLSCGELRRHRPDGRRLRPGHPHSVPEAQGKRPMSVDTGIAPSSAPSAEERQWTARMRRAAESAFPPDRLLPDRQPAFMASWIYVFGVLTVVSLVWVIVTGCILAVMGPSWWHVSSTGHFVNSLHLWSVEAFFFFMVIHLWGKFFMAAWRGNRRLTWATGVISFLVSVAAAFTGYLTQQNFDSQWISTQAKDGINATGAGAFWNVLNFGQMLMWHIVLLPIGVTLIAGLHILLVRRRGIVPPFEPDARTAPDTRGGRPGTGDRHERGDVPASTLQPRPGREGVEGCVRPLRHPQGGLRRPPRRGGAHHAPRRRLLLPGRAGHHVEVLVRRRPGRLRADGSHRAGRLQRHRRVRAALQRHPGLLPAHRLLRAQSVARRAPAHRHGAGLRPRPAADPARINR